MGLMIISYKIIQKMNYESHGTLAIYFFKKKELHEDFAKCTISFNLVK